MKGLSFILSRKSLLTISKSFVRPNLDYADIIYDKPINESFKRKIGLVQYKPALAITDAIKGARAWFRIFTRWKMVLYVLFSSVKLYRNSFHFILKRTIMLLVKERT